MAQFIHGAEGSDRASDGGEDEQVPLGNASRIAFFREPFVPCIDEEGHDVDGREIDEQYFDLHIVLNKKGYAVWHAPIIDENIAPVGEADAINISFYP